MSNVKAGDIAVIICGANKGGIVEVERVDTYWSRREGALCWMVKAAWPLLIGNGTHKKRVDTIGSIRDYQLRPMLPPEEPETVTRDEEVTA